MTQRGRARQAERASRTSRWASSGLPDWQALAEAGNGRDVVRCKLDGTIEQCQALLVVSTQDCEQACLAQTADLLRCLGQTSLVMAQRRGSEIAARVVMAGQPEQEKRPGTCPVQSGGSRQTTPRRGVLSPLEKKFPEQRIDVFGRRCG